VITGYAESMPDHPQREAMQWEVRDLPLLRVAARHLLQRELARNVGAAIDAAGMTPIVWDTGAFPVDSTLLERIESFADDFEGAVLLFTPDVKSVRSGQTAGEPVANIMFEYGYLSA
jgi:predicted nucleotide-binding protein